MSSVSRVNEGIEILIAEDSPTQAAHLTHLLEKRGYLVRAAGNGREALSLLETFTPALVITDVVMPELDGYGLCAAIKAEERWRSIPVMLVTTLADAADVIRGLTCGADNFIRKPYDEKYLLSRVEYLLMNVRLRKNQKMQMGVEITLGSQRHFITSERQQILDLLISTYEQAVQINDDLKARETELAEVNQVLSGLYRIAMGLNQAGTEEQVLQIVLDRALELPRVRAAWIFLRQEHDDDFRLAAARDLPPALEIPGALEGPCSCRKLCLGGVLTKVTNMLECERLQKAGGDTLGLRFHASVPLHLGDRTLGLLNLVGPDEGLFGEEELKVLYNVGNQVAVALDRARLRAGLERLVEERTARLEAEIAERVRAEDRYRLLFDRNPYPTWVYDTETLAFLAVNEAAVRHYGYTSEEFLSMTIKDIRPVDEVPQLLKVMAEKPEGAVPREFGVFKHKTRAGAVIDVEITSTEITFAGRPAGLVLAMDVTEKRRLEQQVLRAQRMESIGTLAGGIAHDLNNLLMPIMMGVTLLKRSETSERSLRALENIELSARRGKELVKQVLSFARGVEGSRVPVQLGDVVREVASMVESTFPKNVSLRVQVPDDLWVLNGDPTQLNQVLLNLCVNARDSMPYGGQISVSARNVEIDEHYAKLHRGLVAGRYVLVEVVDQGMGMTPEVMERIFEPFFTTKDVGRGTGLGLSTVAAILRSHDGSISVYSEPGKGSSFKVHLPAQRRVEQTMPAARPLAGVPRGNGETILVVDDETAILSITEQTLEAFGYKVLTAVDGAQAIGLYALHRAEITAVITDMMMPVMDGAVLIAALRRIDPAVCIIASSGLNANGKTKTGFELADGFRHFLQKPYSAEALLETLHDAIGGK